MCSLRHCVCMNFADPPKIIKKFFPIGTQLNLKFAPFLVPLPLENQRNSDWPYITTFFALIYWPLPVGSFSLWLTVFLFMQICTSNWPHIRSCKFASLIDRIFIHANLHLQLTVYLFMQICTSNWLYICSCKFASLIDHILVYANLHSILLCTSDMIYFLEVSKKN
jgi:hypothetical protein